MLSSGRHAKPYKLRRVVEELTGIRHLRARYDGFLVDLWGVVHDGHALFEEVPSTLAALAESGARVCFVSNSSRLGEQLAASLVEMGLPRSHFVAVVSSGEVTRDALSARDPALFAALPAKPRVLHVGHADFVPWLFDLPLDLVEEGADLVVATGTVPDAAALDALRARLAPLAARGVPLVCTNPDRVVRGSSGLYLAPGAVAHAYAESGGPVFYYGKPHAPIYRAALARLAVDPARVVGVGDMLATDIVGARGAGLDSVLVTSRGVHSEELHDAGALFTREGATPTATIPTFAW
jgi:HAD superfamily hydrolase (TIGR01459 family)